MKKIIAKCISKLKETKGYGDNGFLVFLITVVSIPFIIIVLILIILVRSNQLQEDKIHQLVTDDNYTLYIDNYEITVVPNNVSYLYHIYYNDKEKKIFLELKP